MNNTMIRPSWDEYSTQPLRLRLSFKLAIKILSEVPFEITQIGDLVKSCTTGHLGTIRRITQDNEYVIEWHSGSWSLISHSWCDQIEYLGQIDEI